MKIYYASQSFYPYIGGVSTYLLNLCREMVSRGHEVVEVHLRPLGEMNQEDIKGIEVHRVPREPINRRIMAGYSKFKEALYGELHSPRNIFNKPADRMEGFIEFNEVNDYFGDELSELLRSQPADIVHIHDFQLLFTYKYVPRGTPLILTWHVPFPKNMSRHLSEFLIEHMKEYDKIVFSSPLYIEAAVKLGLPREKTELIYPLANTNLFRVLDVDKDRIREKYGIPSDAKVILSVQRVDPKSGHEQLIRAFRIVKRRLPNSKLVFVGGRSLSNQLSRERNKMITAVRKLADELGLKKDVIFTGNIEYSELPALYNSVDVVALCSRNEGFGLSITEGMACGRPVVGTRVGGLISQIREGENGYLVGVGDIKGTAERLIRILSDDELRKSMSRNSLEIVERNFKMEIGVERHLMLYTSLIEEKDALHRIEYINPKEIRGIITDLDRTITDSPPGEEFNVNDYDSELFEQLKELNIDLFLATGRSLHYVKKLYRAFPIWRGIIAENGAIIYFPRTKKTITTTTSYMRKARRIIEGLNLPHTKIGRIITSNRVEDKKFVKKKLGKLISHLDFIENVNDFLTLPRRVNKGVALRIVMQLLNIDINKTIVIGDGENDIDMFLNPGFKIALSNSTKKLKRLANQIINEPSTRGIRSVIRRLREK